MDNLAPPPATEVAENFAPPPAAEVMARFGARPCPAPRSRQPDFVTLGRRFDEALLYASTAHRQQPRKGTPIPYLSHLLGVASIVLTYHGTEDQAIQAGLTRYVMTPSQRRRPAGRNVARMNRPSCRRSSASFEAQDLSR